MGLSTGAASPRQRGAAGRPRVDGLRPWLGAVGAALVVVSLVPPVATLSRRYLFAESFQFSMFAMVCPALIVLGAPRGLLRRSRWLAASEDRHPSLLRGGVFLLAFVVVTLAWRLPPALDAVARLPGLVAVEAVTLLAVGGGLWLLLVRSPPPASLLPAPQRAVVAALAMWSTWIVAYALGFSSGPVVDAYARGNGLGEVADQEIAVGLVWGVACACFVPVIFASVFSWLREGSDIGEEFSRAFPGASTGAGVKGWDRPRRRGTGHRGETGQ